MAAPTSSPCASWCSTCERFRPAFLGADLTSVQRATQLQDAYGVSGVPAVGVAGRYCTDGTLAGDMRRALAEVNRLIEQVRRARRG